jgi:hypothetical protein
MVPLSAALALAIFGVISQYLSLTSKETLSYFELFEHLLLQHVLS